MAITTVSLLFVLFVLFIYYCCRKEMRVFILAISSIIYAFLVSNNTGICIVAISLLSYISGIVIHHFKNKWIVYFCLTGSIILIIFSLIFLKYFNNLFWAIGYSYFCFQAIGYISDVYNGKYVPIYNPIRLLLFYAYFPKLVSGPIERADEFNEQLDILKSVSLFDEGRLKKSITYIFVGGLYKLVLADRIALIVDGIFEFPHIYQSEILIAGIFLYTIQIYCDFAGYSMFAIGISNLFGIDLVENFCSPYLSVTVGEFWKRWHMSLTNWLRDYIYIPLGGNRKGKVRLYINIFIVFILSGIWHGNGIGFLIWGALHGVLSVFDRLIKIKNKFFSWLLTIISVSFAWMFFKASTWERISLYIESLINNNRAFPVSAQLEQLGVVKLEMIIALITLIFIIGIDFAIKKYQTLDGFINNISLGVWVVLMWIVIIAVVVFGIYGPSFEGGRMIYMQF